VPDTARKSVANHPKLNAAFLAVVVIMAAHQSEHLAQVAQKNVLGEACPGRCRGALGVVFDIEWVHFAYNVAIFVALGALWLAYRMWKPEWRRTGVPWALLTGGIFFIQGYHVVEHVAKLAQWFTNGRRSPTPGVIGAHVEPPIGHDFSLIELHFALNTLVFVCVLAGYFGLGFHRHALRFPRLAPAAIVAALLATAPAAAWAMVPPTVTLEAGVHKSPLVLDRAQRLVGAPGAVVTGGIKVTAGGVTVKNVEIRGGEYGIEVVGVRNVLLEDVTISGAELDGINVRRASVIVRNCRITEPRTEFAQAIDISFTFDLPASHVEGCSIVGGREGIVTHFAKVRVRNNDVSETTLRGIALTEMSMAHADDNTVRDSLGVGIFCGDFSECRIENNTVSNTRPDAAGDDTRRGVAIVAHFGAKARVAGNTLTRSPGGIGAFSDAEIIRDES
jgi:parallel beta-helix repeat protein